MSAQSAASCFVGRYRFRRKVEPLTDMPPIVAQIEPEPGLIPAIVTVLPGRILALRPTANATEEERRIIGRIALAQFLKVLPEPGPKVATNHGRLSKNWQDESLIRAAVAKARCASKPE